MAAVAPASVTLPLGMKAWSLRDTSKSGGKTDTAKIMRHWEPLLRPTRFIAFDTECTARATAQMSGFAGERWEWERHLLLFGCAVIGLTSGWRIEREVIFYPDDLPESGVNILRGFVEERTHRRGAQPRKEGEVEPDRVWRDELRVTARLLPLSRFLKLLYLIAYKDKALVIGFDLAHHLCCLAADWHEVKKGANVRAWHLDLWTYKDPATGEKRRSAGWRPAVIINRKAPDVIFIQFTDRRRDEKDETSSRYRGQFLDPSNLLNGLTGRHWMLGEALGVLTGETLRPDTGTGIIAADCIDRLRTRLRATVSLTGRLIGLFDRLHPISRGAGGRLSETHLYSPGGLARAYPTAAGFTPPVVPSDRLGPCVAAFFGGWAEVQVRGRVPVMHVDFRRQYQSVFLLQGLQDLLAAEQLTFVEDTETIRAFVETVTLDDLLRPETHRCINVLCWIKPAGETMVGRWVFGERPVAANPDRFSLAVEPRYGDLIPVYLGDVLAAKVHCGLTCEIVRAERIVPEGRQHLRKTRLFGGAAFDPDKDQFFKVLVEAGERFGRGQGRYADIPAPIREALLPGIKAIGNVGCFGTLIETRELVLLPNRREEVTLLSDGEPVRASLAHPEDPGPLACPPIAGLVTAGGRLWLAMIHRVVADRGGIVAACDTDGGYIVATADGGTVDVETRGADFYEGGPAQPVHALSFAEVEEIAARFEPLNPFDRRLLPGSPLRIKEASNGLFLSAKRRALTR